MSGEIINDQIFALRISGRGLLKFVWSVYTVHSINIVVFLVETICWGSLRSSSHVGYSWVRHDPRWSSPSSVASLHSRGTPPPEQPQPGAAFARRDLQEAVRANSTRAQANSSQISNADERQSNWHDLVCCGGGRAPKCKSLQGDHPRQGRIQGWKSNEYDFCLQAFFIQILLRVPNHACHDQIRPPRWSWKCCRKRQHFLLSPKLLWVPWRCLFPRCKFINIWHVNSKESSLTSTKTCQSHLARFLLMSWVHNVCSNLI